MEILIWGFKCRRPPFRIFGYELSLISRVVSTGWICTKTDEKVAVISPPPRTEG